MLALTSVQDKDVGSLLELRVRSGDGWRLVEMIGAPLGDDLVLSVRDLTERRRWEVAGDEVARFRSLMQNAASVTMLLTRDGVVESSSGGLTRILGLDQEWLEAPTARRPRRRARPRRCSRPRCARCSTPSPASRPRRSPSTSASGTPIGEPIPFALTLTNLLDDPTVEGLVVTGHDITDRVAAVDDLRAANSVLAATLESTADGILVVDRAGRITSFNSRFAEMWRLPPEHARRRATTAARSRSCSTSCATRRRSSPRSRSSTTSPRRRATTLLEFKDGRVFERDSLPQRIDGEVVGRVWSFRDVTEHRRLQNELIHQAFHDPLTGLANQALFRDRVDHAATRLAAQRRPARGAVHRPRRLQDRERQPRPLRRRRRCSGS